MQRGPEAVTVPGALAGWQTLIKRFGTRTLAQDLQPAIEYAQNGYPVTPVIAGDWAIGNVGRDSNAAKTFLIDGKLPKAGDWFRNPDDGRSSQERAELGHSHLG